MVGLKVQGLGGGFNLDHQRCYLIFIPLFKIVVIYAFVMIRRESETGFILK
jgi:hypothetical protein